MHDGHARRWLHAILNGSRILRQESSPQEQDEGEIVTTIKNNKVKTHIYEYIYLWVFFKILLEIKHFAHTDRAGWINEIKAK